MIYPSRRDWETFRELIIIISVINIMICVPATMTIINTVKSLFTRLLSGNGKNSNRTLSKIKNIYIVNEKNEALI
jgi:hypothetical protein